MMGIADHATAVEMIRERVASREWWVILAADQMGIDMAREVEEAHYQGDAALDFDMLVAARPFDGCPMLGVFFARKSRMTVEQLKAVIDGHTGDPEHDVMTSDTDQGQAALMWFLANLAAGPPATPGDAS